MCIRDSRGGGRPHRRGGATRGGPSALHVRRQIQKSKIQNVRQRETQQQRRRPVAAQVVEAAPRRAEDEGAHRAQPIRLGFTRAVRFIEHRVGGVRRFMAETGALRAASGLREAVVLAAIR